MLSENELRLIQQSPLGIVNVIDNITLRSQPMPLVLSPCQKYVVGHLANSNPLVPLLVADKPCFIQVLGANAYISPHWHQQQPVPTWNYVYCQLQVRIEGIADLEHKMALMDYCSEVLSPEWSFKQMLCEQATMAEKMLNAITFFRFEILATSSRFKLSQHRGQDFAQQMANVFTQQNNVEMAEWMLNP